MLTSALCGVVPLFALPPPPTTKINTHNKQQQTNKPNQTKPKLQKSAVLLDGLRGGVPTGVSVALCFMFGPLGLLAHLATKAAAGALRGSKAVRWSWLW